jgi:hypothetical protein
MGGENPFDVPNKQPRSREAADEKNFLRDCQLLGDGMPNILSAGLKFQLH